MMKSCPKCRSPKSELPYRYSCGSYHYDHGGKIGVVLVQSDKCKEACELRAAKRRIAKLERANAQLLERVAELEAFIDSPEDVLKQNGRSRR